LQGPLELILLLKSKATFQWLTHRLLGWMSRSTRRPWTRRDERRILEDRRQDSIGEWIDNRIVAGKQVNFHGFSAL
jgi:hypothetical protein